MNSQASLERGYRRVLACYPRSFRHENEQEILTVLLDTARDGQRRVGLAESADLIRGALRMRLRPGPGRPPRAVFTAVRLMCAGAAAELVFLITVVVTAGGVRAGFARAHPGATADQWSSVTFQLTSAEVTASVCVVLWLWLAWANGRGQDWARLVFTAFFGLTTAKLIITLADGAAAYAQADLIAGAVVWFVALTSMTLIFSRKSWPYYRRELAQR
jgi:hypothetical protein